MDKKNRVATIVLIVCCSLVVIATIILFIKLIITGYTKVGRWIFGACSLIAAVLFISDGIKKLKNSKE